MNRFCKLLAANMCHYRFTYHEGLNVDHVPFNPVGECLPGGLYFTTFEHLPQWHCSGWPLIADVKVPDDAEVYAEPCGTKWKADKIVLSNIRPLTEFLATLDEDTTCKMLAKNGEMLERIENQTEAMCLVALQRTGFALEFIKNQTEEMCLIAVRKCGHALFFVRKQTDAICLAAVQFCGNALKYVTNQTDEICLAAVQQSGNALVHVRNQTEAICLAAVQQDVCALWHVQNQTEAICRAALDRNARIAYRYIKIPY
jgi:hypothetical protein